jgi:hypothetical protein
MTTVSKIQCDYCSIETKNREQGWINICQQSAPFPVLTIYANLDKRQFSTVTDLDFCSLRCFLQYTGYDIVGAAQELLSTLSASKLIKMDPKRTEEEMQKIVEQNKRAVELLYQDDEENLG